MARYSWPRLPHHSLRSAPSIIALPPPPRLCNSPAPYGLCGSPPRLRSCLCAPNTRWCAFSPAPSLTLNVRRRGLFCCQPRTLSPSAPASALRTRGGARFRRPPPSSQLRDGGFLLLPLASSPPVPNPRRRRSPLSLVPLHQGTFPSRRPLPPLALSRWRGFPCCRPLAPSLRATPPFFVPSIRRKGILFMPTPSPLAPSISLVCFSLFSRSCSLVFAFTGTITPSCLQMHGGDLVFIVYRLS